MGRREVKAVASVGKERGEAADEQPLKCPLALFPWRGDEQQPLHSPPAMRGRGVAPSGAPRDTRRRGDGWAGAATLVPVPSGGEYRCRPPLSGTWKRPGRSGATRVGAAVQRHVPEAWPGAVPRRGTTTAKKR